MMAGERIERVQHLGIQSGHGRDAGRGSAGGGSAGRAPASEATGGTSRSRRICGPLRWTATRPWAASSRTSTSRFSDILKDLSFGAMLLVDVAKGRFGIGVNGLFARVSPDSKVGDIKIDVTSDSGQLGDPALLPSGRLAYRTSSSGAPLRLVVAPEAGFRFTYLRTEIDVHRGRTVDQQRELGRPAGRLAFRARPHRPLCAHHRGQRRRLRGRLRLHLERPGLSSATRPACSAGRPPSRRLSRAVSGLPPPRFRVGRDHARPGHRHRGALLNALKGNKCKEVDDDARALPHVERTTRAGDGRELLRRTAPGGCFADLVHAVIQEARPI